MRDLLGAGDLDLESVAHPGERGESQAEALFLSDYVFELGDKLEVTLSLNNVRKFIYI